MQVFRQRQEAFPLHSKEKPHHFTLNLNEISEKKVYCAIY